MDRVGNKTKQEKYRIRGLTRLEGVNICVEFIFPPLDRVDLICKKIESHFFVFPSLLPKEEKVAGYIFRASPAMKRNSLLSHT